MIAELYVYQMQRQSIMYRFKFFNDRNLLYFKGPMELLLTKLLVHLL